MGAVEVNMRGEVISRLVAMCHSHLVIVNSWRSRWRYRQRSHGRRRLPYRYVSVKSTLRKLRAIMTAEQQRHADTRAEKADWQRWGTYLSERACGTVREDYSADGSAWDYFPHDHARSRAYRWNEDGIGGFCDNQQHLCLAVALWNERDPILKERLFGLTNGEGNHGEDVKEYYFYLDNTPTHSYARMLYKYPQVAFPYAQLVAENARRSASEPEYELFDALEDTFREQRYFDVVIEYAKADAEDILCRI